MTLSLSTFHFNHPSAPSARSAVKLFLLRALRGATLCSRLLAVFAAVFLAFVPSLPAAIGPGPYSSGTCTSSIPNPPSDFLSYTLSLQFPTTGYTLTLLDVTYNKNPVVIRVHYTLAPGPVGDIVVTHSVKFTQMAPHYPATYIVYANGRKLGPAKKITYSVPPNNGIQNF